MMTRRITVFEDDLFFRHSLEIIFEGRTDIVLAGVFPDANNLLQNIKSSDPHLILMDIDMPGLNGINAVKIVRNNFPEIPVIMLTQYDDEDKVINSICAGAKGYLLKSSPPEKMIERIYEVSDGGATLDPVVAQKVLNLFSLSFEFRSQSDNYLLSPREKDVLSHLVKGKPYKTIADELDICYDTVRMHVKKIYEKLQVSSVSGAVAIAVRKNLVPIH